MRAATICPPISTVAKVRLSSLSSFHQADETYVKQRRRSVAKELVYVTVLLINSFNNDILINFKFVHTNKVTQIL